MYTKAKWIRCRSVFSILLSFSLLAVCSCSLLIPLLLIRFNVVVVNGHDDDRDVDYRPCKLYDARDTAIGLELEEAFILNVGRKGRDVGFNSSYLSGCRTDVTVTLFTIIGR